jgi:hypothetical protein
VWLRFDRRAADGIRLRVIHNSHSTINDIMAPASCQATRGEAGITSESAR